MSGGVQAFFASLSPQTQNELIQAASGALSAQHKSIGRNTADASRVRQYLSENDAYAREQLQRMQGQNGAEGDSVSNFQRQNEAFMALMGDDLMPAPKSAPPVQRSASSAKPVQQKPYPLAEDPVNPDARPRNLAQEEATQPYNRDRMPNAQESSPTPQEAPSSSGESDSLDALPYLLSVLGLRAIRPGTKDVAGRTNASVPATTTPDGGKEVGMARAPKDDIIDAEWRDVEQPKQLTQEQRKLPGPNAESAPRQLPLTDAADEYDDVQRILAETLGKEQPRTNFERGKVKEGDVNPNNKEVPKGAARKGDVSARDAATKATRDVLGEGNLAKHIKGKPKVK